MSATQPTPTSSGGNGSGAGSAGGADDLKGRADAAVGTAKDEAASLAGSAVEHARSLMDTATGELREQGTTQTERLASSLHEVSGELRSMADGADHSSALTSTVRSAATLVEHLASRLDEGGPDGVVSDVTAFARRRPGSFLAISAVGGFLTARVLRSADTDSLKQAATTPPEAAGADPQNAPQVEAARMRSAVAP